MNAFQSVVAQSVGCRIVGLLAAVLSGCGGQDSESSSAPAALAALAGLPSSQFSGSADGTGSTARFSFPTGVSLDSFGGLYVADAGNNTIRRVTVAGVVTTFAGTAGVAGAADGTGSAARFDNPFGIATDSAGNVYIADNGSHTIRKVTSAGVVTTLAGTAGVFGASDGMGTAAIFHSPSGVAADSKGNVFVADFNNHTIRKITPTGAVTTFAGMAGVAGSTDGSGSAARFLLPVAVATDSSDNIYVADSSNNTIRKITSAGAVTTLAGTVGVAGSADGVGAAASFAGPRGLAADRSGNLYVADSRNNTIRKITPTGSVSTVVGRSGTPAAFVSGPLPGSLENEVIGVAINGSSLYITTGNALAVVTNLP